LATLGRIQDAASDASFGNSGAGCRGIRPSRRRHSGVPSDRVKILREAFSKAVGDPDVSADVKKKKLELDPTSGEELETLAKEVITSDRAVIDRMKNLLVK